jgi:cytidyltransferase-like protein
MKNSRETDFQYEAVFIDADALLSAKLSVEAVALFCARCASLARKRVQVALVKDGKESLCKERYTLVDIFYAQCQKAADLTENSNLDIQVLFKGVGSLPLNTVEVITHLPQIHYEARSSQVVVPFPQVMPLMLFVQLPQIVRTFDRVLFAGTFDHLHTGHKSVITQALFLADETLYIAVANQELLARKKCPSALEPFDLRIRHVVDFLTDITPECKKHVEIRILETPDAIGPAGWLDFDCIIVTPETISGGENVNTARVANGKPAVEIVVCPILGSMGVDNKVSSTGIRMKLASNGDRLTFLHDHLMGTVFKRFAEMDMKIAQVWWSKLRDMYGLEPWRYFHDLGHIQELLVEADFHYGGKDNVPVEVVLCIWFHDCVYSPRSSTNEEDSVAVFKKFNLVAQLSDDLERIIAQTIMYSKEHMAALSRHDLLEWQRVFLELDLSILGSSSERYTEYAEQIRKEYAHFPDEVYRAKRRAFLESVKGFKFQQLTHAKQFSLHLAQNISWELERLHN